MQPYAYGLRAHEIWQTPRHIDITKTTSRPTPDEWKDKLHDPSVAVLPLVMQDKRTGIPGWCTYTYEHEQAPELEVLCGGINGKTPSAGAIWRQGHLLHFGFDISPAEMNATGQAMLLNSITYIARFTEDRPIVRTPCPFTQGIRIFDRNAFQRLLQRKATSQEFNYVLSKEAYKATRTKDHEEMMQWYQQVRGFLHADKEGKLTVDEEAQSFGISPATVEFLAKAIAALGHPEQASRVRTLLNRYAPDGPGAMASPEQWQAWLEENKPYLFFSDTGGYRWYIDPLAKRRQTPTETLRGASRATLAAVGK